MALVKCEECSKEISSQAESCPYCGYKPKKTGCLGVIGYGILVVIGISLLSQFALDVGSSHIAGRKDLPLIGIYTCTDRKNAHYAKSPGGTINDSITQGIETRINISNEFLSLDVKINGINQSSKPMPYKVDGTQLIATAPVKEDQRTDPMTKKSWISSTTEVVTLDLKTGQMKRVLRGESLNLDRKLSGYETFTLTAKCALK